MYSMVKRVSVFALAMLTLIMGVVVPFRKAEAAIMYNNTTDAYLSCSVNSNGQLQASMSVVGIKNKTTRIDIELYVEKRILGVFWSRVDIGYPNNIWTASTSNYSYSHTFTTNLPSSGTYKVTVTYTVSGSGGSDDIIERTETIQF